MRRSRILRTAAWSALSLLFLAVALVGLLHTPPARRLVLQQAIRLLEKNGIGFSSSGLSFNLLTLELAARDVTVSSLATPSLPALFHADRISLDLSLSHLIRGAYYVDSASIENPEAHLVIDQDGRDNIPKPPTTSDKSSSEIDYLIRQASLSGGSVRFEDRRQPIDALVPFELLTIQGDAVTKDHEIRLKTRDGGHLSLAERSLPLHGFAADVRLGRDSALIRGLHTELGDSSATITGKVEGFSQPKIDLQAEMNLALQSLAEFLGVPQELRGNLHVAVNAAGPLAQLQATVQLNGDGLRVDRFDGIGVRADAAYNSASPRVEVQSVRVVAPLGNVNGKASVALNPQAGDSTATLSADSVNLERISSILRLPVRIASSASARAEARWPGLEVEKAEGRAALQIKPTRQVPAKDTLPVAATIDATTRGNRITVAVKELQTLAATASGEVQLTGRKSLGGQLSIAAPFLSSTLTAAELFLGREPGSLAGTPIEGALTSTVNLAGTVSAPAASMTVSAPDLSAGELRGIALEAAANYTPERLAIEAATVRWRDQTVRAAGEIGLGETQPLRLTARTENLTIGATLAGLGKSDLPVSGQVAATFEVEGTVANPQATVEASASDLRAYQELLGNLLLRGRYSDGRAEVSELRLEKPQPGAPGLLTASGTYEVEPRRYQMQAQTQNFRLLDMTLPDGKPVRGTVQLQASGAGTIDEPAADIKLAVDGLQVDGQEMGAAVLAAQAAKSVVQIQASLPKFALEATASVGVQAPNPVSAEIHLRDTDLSRLPIKLEQPLQGTVSAVIQAKGDLENYEQGSASAAVSKLDLVWDGVSISSDGPLAATYSNRVLTVQQAALTAAGSRLEVAGSLPLDSSAAEGAIQLNAHLDLPGLARLANLESKPEVQGSASIQGSIRGTLKRVDPDLTVSLEKASLAMPGLGSPVTNASLRAQIRDGALELESASADWGTASFQATGTIPFALLPADLPVEIPRRQGPAKLTAALTGANLAMIGLPEGANGMLSVRIDAEAPRAELETVQGTLTFPELRVGFENYSVEQKGVSKIVLDKGVARVEHFQLSGPSTELELAGTAGATGDYPLDLRLDGKLDAAIASAFANSIRARGATEIHATMSGTARDPRANGYLEIAGGQLAVEQPRIAVNGLNLRVDLAESRATISKLEGDVNGGKLSGKGSITLAGGKQRDPDLSVQVDDLFLDFPAGLKTISDVRLQYRTVQDHPVLRGSVLVKQGGFTDDLFLDSGILAVATAAPTPIGGEEPDTLMRTIRLNVSLLTQEPIVLDNNLGRAEITAQLVVLGTPAEPGLAGRLIIEEGGQLTLQERQYNVERGVITFTSDRRIEPNLDILATTTAAEHDITLQISGRPGKTETQLTSNPPLPEPDILALLVTGKTLEQIRGQEFEVAQNQVLSYLTGRVGSSIGRRLEGATGLSRVQIEPSLIAAEANPGARLTVGQDITPKLGLIYSMDLVNSSDQIYAAEYDLTKRFVTRGVRQADGTYRFDFRHDLRFGGGPQEQRTRTRDTRKIGDLAIDGQKYFSAEAIQSKLKVKPGDHYDFFKLRKGMDRITKMYVKDGLLESGLRLERQQKDRTVDLKLNVDAGPRVRLVFEGAAVPGKVEKEVGRVWHSGVFDAQRADDAIGVLKDWLIDDRYLKPEISYHVLTPAPDEKRVVFEIVRGPRFENVELAFEGATAVEPKRLRKVIDNQKLSTEVYTKPERVTTVLSQFYRETGFLDAAVEKPRYELNSETRTGRVVFPVKEGPLYRVGEAIFEGNQAIGNQDLQAVSPLPSGEEYRPILRENALQRVREVYWAKGYNDVDIQVAAERLPEQARVNLRFQIVENAQSITQDIVVSGNRATSENLIRTQLELKPGEPVNLEKVGDSRRNLYNTGAFSLVDIAREDLDPQGTGTHPVRLQVRVKEVQPFEVKYGGFYDTERGPGAIVDFSNRNSLGSARVIGLRARYDSQLHEARMYFSQPLLSRFPLKSIASPYIRREINAETDLTSAFNVDRVGFSVQQEAAFGKHVILNYGYRIERSRTYDTGPDPFFDISLRIASLTATLSRDTRDEVLDASKGSFFSSAIQHSPESLGSQVRFLKYLGQYFRYFPLQKPRVQLFTNEVLRPRLVYATGVRLGLAGGFGGQEVPIAERFFAGGSTTIRGFEQNAVGPATFTGTNLGGQSLLIFNNELRFPLVSIFDGVGFLDVGNVYGRMSDLSLGDLRKAAGAGLRVRTPWFLLRMDYGFKLDRMPGESRGRFFFSIGQAF